jgi:hypothetical protein
MAHPYFEAERCSELTGKSFNRCLDEIYEEEMSARQTMEEAERQHFEQEMQKHYEEELRQYWEQVEPQDGWKSFSEVRVEIKEQEEN